jgi:hypothetical protein
VRFDLYGYLRKVIEFRYVSLAELRQVPLSGDSNYPKTYFFHCPKPDVRQVRLTTQSGRSIPSIADVQGLSLPTSGASALLVRWSDCLGFFSKNIYVYVRISVYVVCALFEYWVLANIRDAPCLLEFVMRVKL